MYGLDGSDGLYRVSADGGTPVRITVPDSTAGERAQGYPHAVPGGSAVLVAVVPTEGGEVPRVDALDLDSGERTPLTRGSDPWYTDDGHIVYALPDGSIIAQPFDAVALNTIGGPFRIAEGVVYRAQGVGEFGMSRNGTMVTMGGGAASSGRLVLVYRSGGLEVLP